MEAPASLAKREEFVRTTSNSEWRGELSRRVEAYRVKRGHSARSEGQSQLPFEAGPEPPAITSVDLALEEPVAEPAADDFAFTIAIGRCSPSRQPDDSQMFIDVSAPAENTSIGIPPASQEELPPQHTGMYPVASIDERRIAAVIDMACLIFSCGGFLMLIGSLGGQFTFSKLTAAVYAISFGIVYLQYFSLFTVFGGTTPGMMLRGLRVVDFSGEAPAPKQLLLRAAGYILSAGALFMGFLWAMWDEDELTWHDRISRTYLSSAETVADTHAHHHAAHS